MKAEGQTIIKVAAQFENLIRAKLLRAEFRARLVNLDIFRC